MNALTAKAAEAVQGIRSTYGWALTDADVFVSSGGDAMVWLDEDTVLHIDTHGAIEALAGEWSPPPIE